MADKAEDAELKSEAKESVKVKQNHIESLHKTPRCSQSPKRVRQLMYCSIYLLIFQDAKSDNAATEDSKEDTKNGEKDENEESSEEEEHPGSCISIAEFLLALSFGINLLCKLLTAYYTQFYSQ